MKYRYTTEEKVTLWLDSFDSLTHRQKWSVLEQFGSVELIGSFPSLREKLLKIISAETYEQMSKTLESEKYLVSLLRELEKKDVFFVSCFSEYYPKSLKDMPAPPLILYCKGNVELLKTECFAIVGSRKMLPWARKLTERVAATVSESFTVVTGIALGGDTAALKGALEGKDRANLICVLANGFDHIYPATQNSLFSEIAKKGLVVTEHRPEVKPQKFLYPVRNRIIAGLSRGVLVTGAGKRSGTTITANYAIEYGRDVFAFPYNPGIAEGEGCNALIKSGAMLAEGAQDILSVYGLSAEEERSVELTEEESEIMRFLSESGEMHVEKLAEKLKKPAYLLSGTLSGLEIKGLVVRSGGNRYGVVGNGRGTPTGE